MYEMKKKKKMNLWFEQREKIERKKEREKDGASRKRKVVLSICINDSSKTIWLILAFTVIILPFIYSNDSEFLIKLNSKKIINKSCSLWKKDQQIDKKFSEKKSENKKIAEIKKKKKKESFRMVQSTTILS